MASPTAATDPEATIPMHSLLPTARPSAKSSGPEPLLEHFEDLRATRFFLYLTIIRAIMFVINIVQVALLDRFNHRLWVLGFPAIVFVSTLLALLAWMFRTRRTLLRSWHEADRPTRIARIGIVCSILLPVICCEFLYLNLYAVPAIRQKVWDVGLSASPELRAPSLILFQESWNKELDIKPRCVTNMPLVERCLQAQQEIDTLTFQHNDTSGLNGTIQYLLYDATKDPFDISTESGPLLHYDVVYLEPKPVSDNYATVQNHLLWFAVFDPRLTNDLAHAIDCGIVLVDLYPVDQSTAVGLYLEQTTIIDTVGALTLPTVKSSLTNGTESCDAASFSNYNTYSYRMLELGGPPDIQNCTESKSSGSCPFGIGMQMSSALVTERTSKRGTNLLKMLLDQGSILAGIAFVTWFLGIYVI